MPYKDKEKQKIKNREYQKKHYRKKPQYYKKKSAERQEKIRLAFKEIKSKLACACGENHPACLDFHHLDPSKKEINLGHAVKMAWGIERIKKEIEKCIVLCANCHRKLHCGVDWSGSSSVS